MVFFSLVKLLTITYSHIEVPCSAECSLELEIRLGTRNTPGKLKNQVLSALLDLYEKSYHCQEYVGWT